MMDKRFFEIGGTGYGLTLDGREVRIEAKRGIFHEEVDYGFAHEFDAEMFFSTWPLISPHRPQGIILPL